MTLNIAHRGASQDAPENTLEAFALAIDQGAEMIETDLHLTRDGKIALYHDREIQGKKLKHLDLAELLRLQPNLPTLDQVLDEFGDRIPFNLEFKSVLWNRYRLLPALCLEEVCRRGLLEQTLFSCFYDGALARLRRLEPSARIALLTGSRLPFWLVTRAMKLCAEAVNPHRRATTPEFVSRMHHYGLRVNVFVSDEAADQRKLIDWGVDGIFTNRPAQLGEILGS